VRFAAVNERAEIRDEYRPCDMTINIVTYLCAPARPVIARPGPVAPARVPNRFASVTANRSASRTHSRGPETVSAGVPG
jgi:hypothetical protein